MKISFDEEEDKDKAIKTMRGLIALLKKDKIRIKHCWLYRDFWDDDEIHNWFSFEWLDSSGGE